MVNLEINNKEILSKPNIKADIIPGMSAGGYSLEMDFNNFLNKISKNFIHQDKEIDLSLTTHNSWVIERFSNEYFLDYKFAYWNNIVILRFGNDNKLNFIKLKKGYRGKLFKKVGINDRLDILIDDYYFLFYYDVHLLVDKIKNRKILDKYIFDNDLYDIDICNDFDIMSIIYNIDDIITVDGVEFNTNYLTQYSKEYSNQIIEEIIVFSNQY